MADNDWTACPTCHGEGKITKYPSRKARLRHKRAKTTATTTTESSPPLRLDPCQKCNQTGLVLASSPVSANTDYPLHVAIIGGGLGGLALGVACMHRQIPFQIFERDTHFSQRAQGYGLTMQQASGALAAFGITSMKDGITSTKHIVHTSDGTVVGEWGLRKWGRDENKRPPKRQNVHIARQALRHELLEALGEQKDSVVSWGHKLINMNEKVDNVELEFEVGNEKVIYSKANLLVVGADGIRSAVRQHLAGEQTPLRYLGCLVVLGICQLDVLESSTRQNLLLDGETVFQTADGSTRIYLMPYSTTEYMWQLSFPMEDEDLAKEISRRGPNALKEEALAKCNAWHTPIPELLQKTPVELVSGYPVYDRDLITLDMLNGAKPVTLLGDAAHPMSPFKGQGANQALLDALSLARSLYSTCCRKQNPVFEATSAYHEEMTNRSSKKVQASAQAAQFLHTDAAIQEGNVTRGAAAASRLNNK
jgi:2-polyprenyl-6-methoxyphenol hydroxylase-like FAD-dependent oxidoreductase